MSSVEQKYDQFLSELKQLVGPLDVNFATRLMYLERKMAKSLQPSVKPHVVLTIRYKNGIDRNDKISSLRDKGYMTENLDDPNEILCAGYMNIDDVLSITSDPDVENATGKASPIIRG